LEAAVLALSAKENWPEAFQAKIMVEYARDKSHGDFASNFALVNAKALNMNPRQLAEVLVEELKEDKTFSEVSIAGPGFINFKLGHGQKTAVIQEVLQKGAQFGDLTLGQGKKVLVEYVSANPTGPLHVGHGRGAAYGSSLANVLKKAGFDVTQEYYVNDAGRQMKILAASVWLRYLSIEEPSLPFPDNGYKGAYVEDIAKALKAEHQEAFMHSKADVLEGLPKDECDGGDKERYIDAVIEKAESLLGTEGFQVIFNAALTSVLEDIKDDLSAFGTNIDSWFSEQSLFDSGALDKGIEALAEKEKTYQKEGALWFKSTDYGDDKDRVLKRANGQSTYFASDVAYHWNKFDRGFDRLIDVFGADHHGYIARVRAAASALGHAEQDLMVKLVQFAILYRGDVRVPMSTRSGEFVTIRELREEVGVDAARFFYVMRKSDQHMDFDLELAKKQSNDNPVYYIQYAHARICSVFAQLDEKGFEFSQEEGLAHLQLLTDSHELSLCEQLSKYPAVIQLCAEQAEPHHLAYYLKDLATSFHSFYNSCQLLIDDRLLRSARLCLIKAAQQILQNGLFLLGVSAPRRM
jgi:arginyl-tRNA synthetase